jgi:hypothetical protein
MTHTKDEALKLAAEFDKRFTSMNGIDVPERVSVPRDEWRALHTAIKELAAQPATKESSETQTASAYVKTYHGGKPWPLQPAPVPEGCVVVARAVLNKLGIDDAVVDTIARQAPPAQPAPEKSQPLIDLRQDAWNKINSPEQVAALDKTIVDFASGTKGQP